MDRLDNFKETYEFCDLWIYGFILFLKKNARTSSGFRKNFQR